MKKEDIQLWLEYITLNTVSIRNMMYNIVKDKKLSEIDFNSLNWYLERIDHTTNHIKRLTETD